MEITNTEVYGFQSAFRGMRNPMNSWHMSDSHTDNGIFIIGEKDLKLAQNLINSGGEHSKFMRQIQVWADFNMPRYWHSEMDTYHFNTKNSCSTMHKLLSKDNPITCDMFVLCKEDTDLLDEIICRLNSLRLEYIKTKNPQILVRAKRILPEGFLQLRTINTNYAEIRNIYNQRQHHRLKEEWIDTFCGWVDTLPYAAELIKISAHRE